MSRIGKQPIALPKGVEASFSAGVLTVKGPKGTLSRKIDDAVNVTIENNSIVVSLKKENDGPSAIWGTIAAHANNMVEGVTKGFTKILEIEGVGYRAELKGKDLVLSVGFSHPVALAIPEGVSVAVEKGVITLNGNDKEAVGQFAADVRKVKKPEPYKGKGIHYRGEYIIRKQGKKAV